MKQNDRVVTLNTNLNNDIAGYEEQKKQLVGYILLVMQYLNMGIRIT